MKNSLIYLFIVSLMLQSCFSYKSIKLEKIPLKVGGIYKIKQEDKFVKAMLKAKTDSTLTFIINKNEIQINTTNIEEIKVRKFSALKTLVFAAGTMGTVTLVSLIALSLDFDFDFSHMTVPN